MQCGDEDDGAALSTAAAAAAVVMVVRAITEYTRLIVHTAVLARSLNPSVRTPDGTQYSAHLRHAALKSAQCRYRRAAGASD